MRATERTLLMAVYGTVLLAPLALIAGVAKPGAQGVLVAFADSLGFAAMSLLALQVFTSGRWSITTRAFGLRAVLSMHRQVGVAVLVLVVMHLGVLVVDDPARMQLLDLRTAPGRARAGVTSLACLLLIAGTSIYRSHLRLSYERWRGTHLVLTGLALATAFMHVVWVDAYTSLPLERWTVLLLVLAAAIALFWTRAARPYSTAMRPYEVLAVTREQGDAVTVDLSAVGHRGLRFQAGQFARLRGSECLYGMDDHPFTLSSSAHHPDRPSFTVKALGDFSSSLADLRVGTQLLVDGPHGEGVHDARTARGRLLIAAGIGITPAVSVLRTAAERNDERPYLLLYGCRRWEDVTFREELEDLAARLPGLRMVLTLSRPDETWTGERGRVGAELLRRHAPRDVARWSALICGPGPMVTESVSTLQQLGVPPRCVQAEGFG